MLRAPKLARNTNNLDFDFSLNHVDFQPYWSTRAILRKVTFLVDFGTLNTNLVFVLLRRCEKLAQSGFEVQEAKAHC